MTVTTKSTEYSAEWAKQLESARGSLRLTNPENFGSVRFHRITFTQGAAAGDATSTQGLLILPAGRYRLLELALDISAFGASRTLDVGWGDFDGPDGVNVVADPNGLISALDVSGALVGSRINAATGRALLIDSKEAVEIYSTVAGGTIPAGATIKGHLLTGQA